MASLKEFVIFSTILSTPIISAFSSRMQISGLKACRLSEIPFKLLLNETTNSSAVDLLFTTTTVTTSSKTTKQKTLP